MLTIAQVSQLLNIKPSTLYAWVRQQKIPYIKIHGVLRFPPNDLQEWLGSFQGKAAKTLNFSEKSPSTIEELDHIIVQVKQEAYNASQRETRPKVEPKKKGGDHGAL